MVAADALPPLETFARDLRIVQSTLVTSATLLTYDYLCTLDQEVVYVWREPLFSVSSWLFFANRYLPFIDTFLSLSLKVTRNSPEECFASFTVVTLLILFGIMLSEIILMLRTYAIWDRHRSVLVILSVLAAVVLIPAVIITYFEIRSLQYGPIPLPGCHLVRASPMILIAYILLVLSETTMAVLTAIKAYRHLRHSQSRWVIQLYQDGLIFYLYLLAISLANILVPIVAPPAYANLLATPQRVLHSILCNRVLFLIFRQRSSSMTNRNREGSEPSPVFTSYVEHDYMSTSMEMTVMSPSSSQQKRTSDVCRQ